MVAAIDYNGVSFRACLPGTVAAVPAVAVGGSRDDDSVVGLQGHPDSPGRFGWVCSSAVRLVLLVSGYYRCPSGPPGPALARAHLGPVGIVSGLARHYDTSGHAGAAHMLQWQPRHGPTGQFHVGSARTARPYPRTRAARSPPHSSMPPPWGLVDG
jgi:hypothetical protein